MQPKVNPNPGVFESAYPLLDYLNHPLGYLGFARKIKGANRMQQWQLPEIVCELYIVLPPAQYGVLLAIRTGPADFSRLLVTKRQKGGWLPSNAKVKEGQVWLHGDPLPMPEEVDFFKFCGLPDLLPSQRDEYL